MSAKTITVTSQTVLCELQEVKILREADFDIDQNSENSAKIASHSVEEHELQLPEGVNLDESALNEEQKEEANKMFRKWNNIFSHLALFSLRTESDNPDATCELSP